MITRFNFEVSEVVEYPSIFQGMEDGVEEFTGGGDDGFACPPLCFDVFVEVVQVGAVSLGDQGALHERGAGDFIAVLGDSADTLSVIGLADA